ncbi:T9SS type A sorting domain-containing protein [Hymenobacter rubripertinctus]|uniref:T9SS C-terminal target domain-containing protein n=1 Tax=Hymenobacter rubripertinctus TaxID=2029981 RepID=A0A418QZ80_9BACT|nr:T9SS type A sorting domain-containing protein [Hymenobacter rubripertinctus]RIY10490.1 T9SS C-terminal target domain-containing protein [Hymenobacter rubripertinctus]
MKKNYILASALLLATATTSFGQGTELFFSEYIEGAHQSGTTYGGTTPSTGNERAIEVFNPTVAGVSLDKYSVRRYSNGSSTPSEEEKLKRTTGSNVLNSADVFVYANGESTLPAILNVVDQLGASPYGTVGPNTITKSGIAYFNGNDALALVRWTGATAGQGTGILVDIFGVIGQDPGISWSAEDANGVLVTSANQSLMRRPSVSAGTKVNPQPQGGNDPKARTGYNISTEWDSYSTAFPGGVQDPAAQSYARLGEHNDYNGPYGAYAPLKTLAKFNSSIGIYPNPASGQAIVEIKGAKVGSITVLNSVGQTIMAQPRGLNEETVKLDISRLSPGLYFVQFISQDGQLKVYKELLVK